MTFTNLLIGLPVMLLCLIVQVAAAFWCVRYYLRHADIAGRGFFSGTWPLVVAMLAMLVGTLLQIGAWAALFVWLGEFDNAYDAVYHSAVNFSSLGYGDIVMKREHRLLGPLESVNGVLMLGMTAAALMAILQQMIAKLREAAAERTGDRAGGGRARR